MTQTRRGRSRPRSLGLTLALLIPGAFLTVFGLIFGVVGLATQSAATVSAYTQSHGVREHVTVKGVAVHTERHCTSQTRSRTTEYHQDCWTSYDSDVTVALPRAVGGRGTSVFSSDDDGSEYPQGTAVTVLVDPRQPGHAEIPGQPDATRTLALVFEIVGASLLVVGLVLLIWGLFRIRYTRKLSSAAVVSSGASSGR